METQQEEETTSHKTDTTLYNDEPIDYELYPLTTGAERLAVFEKARGMFKGRVKDILAELEEIHNEFNRPVPPLSS